MDYAVGVPVGVRVARCGDTFPSSGGPGCGGRSRRPGRTFGPTAPGVGSSYRYCMSEFDEYFRGLDEPTRAAFEHVRELAREVAPDAEDGWSYGMAALRYKRRPLLGFRTTKDHLSIFPFSEKAVDAVRDDLSAYVLSKGTVRFTPAKPLPDKLVRDIVRYRVKEIDAAVH